MSLTHCGQKWKHLKRNTDQPKVPLLTDLKQKHQGPGSLDHRPRTLRRTQVQVCFNLNTLNCSKLKSGPQGSPALDPILGVSEQPNMKQDLSGFSPSYLKRKAPRERSVGPLTNCIDTVFVLDT